MIRVDGAVGACDISKRPRVMVVESYELYDWRKCVSIRQSKLSSGEKHLVKGT